MSVPTRENQHDSSVSGPSPTTVKENENLISTSSLAAELRCPLCLSTFVDPRVLACQHCFCLKCLYAHWNSASRVFAPNNMVHSDVACPLKCQEITSVMGSLDSLPKNYIISRLALAVRTLEVERFFSGTSDEGSSCEWCSAQSGRPCLECKSFICDKCTLPRSLHYSLCLARVKTAERDQNRRESGCGEGDGKEQHKETPTFIQMFGERDAVQKVFLEIGEKSWKGSVDVGSFGLHYVPVIEYTIHNKISDVANFNFCFYYGLSCGDSLFSCNSYFRAGSRQAIMLRVLQRARELVQSTQKGTTVIAREILECAKNLLPRVDRKAFATERDGGHVSHITQAPIGYQFFSFHLLWLAKQQLFIVYHTLYPLLSKLLYSQLTLVEFLFRGGVNWLPHASDRSSSSPPGALQEASNPTDLFSKGGFHNTWTMQIKFLHCSVGELAECIEGLEEAVEEVNNLLQESIYLGSQSKWASKVEVPTTSLRYFLKEEKEPIKKINKEVHRLFRDCISLRAIESRSSADALEHIKRCGRSDVCNDLIKLQRDISSGNLQFLYLMWGNHRLHYSIISTLVAKSILDEKYGVNHLPMLLQSVYGNALKPYEVLNHHLLACLKDYEGLQPSRSLQFLLPCWKLDMERQMQDGQDALENACKVTGFSSMILQQYHSRCRIRQPWCTAASPSQEECFKILEVITSPSFNAIADGVDATETTRSPWLKDLDDFVSHYITVDLSFNLMYLCQDAEGIPRTSIFDHSWNDSAFLDVTLPFPSLQSARRELGAESSRPSGIGTLHVPQLELCELLDVTGKLLSLEEEHSSPFAGEEEERVTGGVGEASKEELTEGVTAIQRVAAANWINARSYQSPVSPEAFTLESQVVPFAWSVQRMQKWLTPFYYVHFTCGTKPLLLMFNAHNGEHWFWEWDGTDKLRTIHGFSPDVFSL